MLVPGEGHETRQGRPPIWQSRHPALQYGRGRQKSRRAESDSNIPLVQEGSRVPQSCRRTKESVRVLEYKPCLESGNALEGTSGMSELRQPLILPKGRTPQLPCVVSTSFQAPSSQSPALLAPFSH